MKINWDWIKFISFGGERKNAPLSDFQLNGESKKKMIRTQFKEGSFFRFRTDGRTDGQTDGHYSEITYASARVR